MKMTIQVSEGSVITVLLMDTVTIQTMTEHTVQNGFAVIEKEKRQTILITHLMTVMAGAIAAYRNIRRKIHTSPKGLPNGENDAAHHLTRRIIFGPAPRLLMESRMLDIERASTSRTQRVKKNRNMILKLKHMG